MPSKPIKAKLWNMNGLSGRLLLLTIVFVFIGEFFIFVPSIANFRNVWLEERLAKAQIATLVLESAPDAMVTEELKQELLTNVGAEIIVLKRGDRRHLILQKSLSGKMIEANYDLRNETVVQQIMAAFDSLLISKDRLIRVRGDTRFGAGDFIEIVIDEQMMRSAMWVYAQNILVLSTVLSLIVAIFVYMAMSWLLVRPILRITQSIVDFGHEPDLLENMIVPSKRSDEVGVAETRLFKMQQELQDTLREKNRLAALGLAVSKISHDLRNMLSSTQMISDRLQNSADPTVAKLAPKLEMALDRAISFCVRTLKYGQAKEDVPEKSNFALLPLLDDVADSLNLDEVKNIQNLPIDWAVSVEANDLIYADRHQLFRIVLNICRNASEVLKTFETPAGINPTIFIDYIRTEDMQYLLVADNGHGVMPRAKEKLFLAFQGSLRPGGTGLGLAISQELAVAHGGDIILIDNESVLKTDYTEIIDFKQMCGAVFLISLPKQPQS